MTKGVRKPTPQTQSNQRPDLTIRPLIFWSLRGGISDPFCQTGVRDPFGPYGFDPYAVFSYQHGRFSPHARLGYQFNTTTELLPPLSGSGGNGSLPGGFQYDAGVDFVLFRKVPTTVAGDMLGYYVVNSPYLELINVDIPGNPSAPSLLHSTSHITQSSSASEPK